MPHTCSYILINAHFMSSYVHNRHAKFNEIVHRHAIHKHLCFMQNCTISKLKTPHQHPRQREGDGERERVREREMCMHHDLKQRLKHRKDRTCSSLWELQLGCGWDESLFVKCTSLTHHSDSGTFTLPPPQPPAGFRGCRRVMASEVAVFALCVYKDCALDVLHLSVPDSRLQARHAGELRAPARSKLCTLVITEVYMHTHHMANCTNRRAACRSCIYVHPLKLASIILRNLSL